MNIALRVLAATAVPFLVFGLLMSLGRGGLVVVGVMAVAATPVLCVACLTTLLAARRVARRPFVWSFAAVVVAWLVGALVANTGGAMLSSFVTLPAMGLFLLSFAIWPSPFREPAS